MILAALCAASAMAVVVDVSKEGAEKKAIEIKVANPAFAKCLKRNLELSGAFVVRDGAPIKVSGAVGGTIKAAGGGIGLSLPVAAADDAAVRMDARKFANAIIEKFADQQGMALDKVVFINRGKKPSAKAALPGEICTAYPDGYDIRSVTSDGKTSSFPRWLKPNGSILYIGYLNGSPQIWELDTVANKRKLRWSFSGSPTGIAVSPDGSKVAAILSVHGNPELYVIDIASERCTRLTKTPNATEGQPAWSPDGRFLAYVSDETRHPQIYVIDVATKKSHRVTKTGTQNVDPDWGADGRLAYITKRSGQSFVAVMKPSEGEASVELVTDGGSWEHPSWSRDRRHLVAGRDQALFVIDTMKDGDAPRQMFNANGNWITPSWSR